MYMYASIYASYFDSNFRNCLNDTADVYDPVEFQDHLQKELGEIYSITDQCERLLGPGSKQGCAQVSLNLQTNS